MVFIKQLITLNMILTGNFKMKLYACNNRDNCSGIKNDKLCEFYYPKKITHFSFSKKRIRLRVKQQFERTKNLDKIQFYSSCKYINNGHGAFYLNKVGNK